MTKESITAVVDKWFAEMIQGTVVGRYTDVYNIVINAKSDLTRRLIAALDEPAPAVSVSHTSEQE